MNDPPWDIPSRTRAELGAYEWDLKTLGKLGRAGLAIGKAAEGMGDFSLTPLGDWGTLFQTQADVKNS